MNGDAEMLTRAQLVHTGQSANDSSRAPPAPMSDAEFNRRLQEMIKLPELDPPGDAELRWSLRSSFPKRSSSDN